MCTSAFLCCIPTKVWRKCIRGDEWECIPEKITRGRAIKYHPGVTAEVLFTFHCDILRNFLRLKNVKVSCVKEVYISWKVRRLLPKFNIALNGRVDLCYERTLININFFLYFIAKPLIISPESWHIIPKRQLYSRKIQQEKKEISL